MNYFASGVVTDVQSSVEVHGGGVGGHVAVDSTHATTFGLSGRTYLLKTRDSAPISSGDRLCVAGRERGGVRRVSVLVNQSRGYAVNASYAVGAAFGLALVSVPIIGLWFLYQAMPESSWEELKSLSGMLLLLALPAVPGLLYLRESLHRYLCIAGLRRKAS